jgi:hypothetical protein
MSALSLNVTVRNSRAQQIFNALDANTNPGVWQFYTAPRPTLPGDAVTTQTLLGTCTLSKPSGTVSAGVATFASITDDALADADGYVAWVRMLDGAGGWVADCDVTLTSGAGPIKLPSLRIYQGGTIHVATAVLTEGNA